MITALILATAVFLMVVGVTLMWCAVHVKGNCCFSEDRVGCRHTNRLCLLAAICLTLPAALIGAAINISLRL